MTLAMELQRQKKAGFEEGKAEEKRLTAMEMLRNGLSVEKIAQYTRLSLDYIKKLQQEQFLR